MRSVTFGWMTIEGKKQIEIARQGLGKKAKEPRLRWVVDRATMHIQ